MSDSEAVVEKRRGRPSKDKSEEAVKEPKKRGREVEKKEVAKKDDGETPAKRGRGRPPKTGALKKYKPKGKAGNKRGRPKKGDKKEKEESAEDEDSKEDNEEDDE